LDITWGGLVGDRGHRKGQLRVLGAAALPRSQLRNPGPGGHRGGGESADPVLFLRKSLRAYLRVLKPDCGPPQGPIGNRSPFTFQLLIPGLEVREVR
jgi:hypothetical protein